MTLNSYERQLIAPLGTGDGHGFYDFETMWLFSKKYPLDGTSAVGEDGNIEPHAHVGYIHELLHYFQHTLSTVGMYQAFCRFNRIRHSERILNCMKGSRGSSSFGSPLDRPALVTREEIKKLLSEKPFLPEDKTDTEEVRAKKSWYLGLAGEKALIQPSQLAGVDGNITANLSYQFLSIDAFWHAYQENESAMRSPREAYSGILTSPYKVIRYNDGIDKRPIDTINLIENQCAVFEICLLHMVAPESAKDRVTSAKNSAYLVATEYALWLLDIEFSSENIHKYAPELMLITEMALNPPLPPYDHNNLDEEAVSSIENILPPLRFDRLIEASKELGEPLTVGNMSKEYFRKRQEALIGYSSVPVSSVFDLSRPKKPIRRGLEVFDADFDGSVLFEDRMNWLDWYFAFQSATRSVVLQDATTITEFAFLGLIRNLGTEESNPFIEPPKVVTENGDLRLNSFMARNQATARAWAFENLATYYQHDLLLGNGDFETLPFGLPIETVERWGLLSVSDLTNTIVGRI